MVAPCEAHTVPPAHRARTDAQAAAQLRSKGGHQLLLGCGRLRHQAEGQQATGRQGLRHLLCCGRVERGRG